VWSAIGIARRRTSPADGNAIDMVVNLAREHPPAGADEEWVWRLPELIEAICEECRLCVDVEVARAGARGIAVYCHTDTGREAVLKLCPNQERLRAETNALLWWASGPAIGVLAYRPGALLLQRARPGTPSRLGPSQLARLLDALHRPAASDRAGLADWRASINAAVAQVPALKALGRELLRDGEGRPVRSLHGDLQPSNILKHRGSSAVIDPIGIAGPRELDVANAALYNDWGEDSSARIKRLSKLTRTDPAFALRFGQLSAIYANLVNQY
jgi:streptomycin 6-kinase